MQLYRSTVLIIETGDEAKRRLAASEELGLSVLFALQNASGDPSGRPPIAQQSSVEGLPNGGLEQHEEDPV